jgi:phosphoesterase RecJ-like protein
MATIPELAAWIEARDAIAVVAHVSPDGDTLGSGLALVQALTKLNKRAALVSKDNVPHMYQFLPGVDKVYAPDALPFEPQCVLFEDVAAYDRAGDKGALASVKDTALIDHHGTNPCFAQFCVIDEDASATGVIALRLIDQLGVKLDREMALNLYAAISTDTGNFSYSNTTAEAARGVARCLEVGFDIEDASRRLFRLRTRPRTLLLGMALSAVEFFRGGRIAVTRISSLMYEVCGASTADTEGVINVLIETEGVDAAIVAEERGVFNTKFSLRSAGRIDVGEVAQFFGGGGHKQAAGMTIHLPLHEAADEVITKICSELSE